MLIFLDVTARLADEFVQCVFPEEKDAFEISAAKFGLSCLRVDEHDCHVHLKGPFKDIAKMYTWLQSKQRINSRRQTQLSLQQGNCTDNTNINVKLEADDETNRNDLGDSSVVFNKDVTCEQISDSQPRKSSRKRKSNVRYNLYECDDGDRDNCESEVTENEVIDGSGDGLHSDIVVTDTREQIIEILANDNGEYCCPQCSFTERDLGLVLTHIQEHTNQQPVFECSLCNMTFSTNDECIIHQTSHKTVRCEICGFVAKSAAGHALHSRKHKSNQVCLSTVSGHTKDTLLVTKCARCGEAIEEGHTCVQISEYEIDDKILYHDYIGERNMQRMSTLSSEPNGDGVFPCIHDGCDFTAAMLSGTQEHYSRVHAEKAWECKICHKMSLFKRDTKRHITLTHLAKVVNRLLGSVEKGTYFQNADGLFQCKLCNHTAHAKKAMHLHYIRKHTSERNFQCGICNRDFATKQDAIKHCDRNHTNRAAKVCDVCGKAFKDYKWYEIHRKAHELGKTPGQVSGKNRKLRGFTCEYCGKRFSYRRMFLDHVEMEHLQTRDMYRCPVCQKEFSNKRNWKEHSRRHLNIHPYSCSICAKGFTTSTSLKWHKLTHGAKQHECPVCKKMFLTAFKVKEHMKFHLATKEFVCRICAKACSLKSELKAHVRRHFDVTPFICLICNKKFKFHYNCKAHIIRCHKVDKEDIFVIQKSMTNYKTKYDENEHGNIKKEWIKSAEMGLDLETVPLVQEEITSGIVMELKSGELEETTDHRVAVTEGEKTFQIIIHQSQDEVEVASEANGTVINDATYASEMLANLGGAAGDMYVLTDDQTSFVRATCSYSDENNGEVVWEKPSLQQVIIEAVENEQQM